MNSLLFLTFLLSSAHANFWDGGLTVTQNYACIGVDGLPIGNGGSLAAQCCSGGYLIYNAPPTCYAGFVSITTDAATGSAGGITVAQTTLTNAANMNGNSTDNTTPVTTTTNGTAPIQSEHSADTAGGFSGTGATAGSGDNSGISGAGAGGTGSGGGGAGASGSASGSGALGTAGGTSADITDGANGAGVDPNLQKATMDAYSKGSGAGAGSASGGGMFGSLFGGSGAGAGGVGDDGKKDLTFGEDGKPNGTGLGANGDDGDGKGTTEDPSDYFNRIDKSANIFKVVSTRYMKKKSLWAIPQKLPDELKQKAI